MHTSRVWDSGTVHVPEAIVVLATVVYIYIYMYGMQPGRLYVISLWRLINSTILWRRQGFEFRDVMHSDRLQDAIERFNCKYHLDCPYSGARLYSPSTGLWSRGTN